MTTFDPDDRQCGVVEWSPDANLSVIFCCYFGVPDLLKIKDFVLVEAYHFGCIQF